MSKLFSVLRGCVAAVALVASAASHAEVVSSGSNNPLAFSWSFNTGNVAAYR